MKDSTKDRLEKISEFTIVPLIAIIIGLLVQSCGDSRTYDDGYNDGYSVGEDAGYNHGKDDGYDAGYNDGYRDGQEDAKLGIDKSECYVTDLFFHFHNLDCELVKNAPDKQLTIVYISRQDLIDKGYEPCETCNP